MTSACFFNQQASDCLQHVAIVFEVMAIVMLIRDRYLYKLDTGRQQRASGVGVTLPRKRRSTEFWTAVVVGGFAVLMEIYQLLSQPQYLGC